MLNTAGHMTIIWPPESDDAMEAIIQRKMDAGVMFYMLEPVAGGLAAPRETGLIRPMDARHRRALAIHDEDLAKFVGDGLGEATLTPSVPEPAAKKPARKARTAKEVAAAPNAVGVSPRRGG
jgi:hypothetical protein